MSAKGRSPTRIRSATSAVPSRRRAGDGARDRASATPNTTGRPAPPASPDLDRAQDAGSGAVVGRQALPAGRAFGAVVTLASGFADDADALPIRTDARIVAAHAQALKAGESADYPLGADRHGYLVVPATARSRSNGTRLEARDGAAIAAEPCSASPRSRCRDRPRRRRLIPHPYRVSSQLQGRPVMPSITTHADATDIFYKDWGAKDAPVVISIMAGRSVRTIGMRR